MDTGSAATDLARQARQSTGWDTIALALSAISGLAAFAPWLDSGTGEVATGWTMIVGRATLVLAGIVAALLLAGIVNAGERLTFRVMALFGAMLNSILLLGAGVFALFGLAILYGIDSMDASSSGLEISLAWGYWIALLAAAVVPFVTIVAATRPYRNWIDRIPVARRMTDPASGDHVPPASGWPVR